MVAEELVLKLMELSRMILQVENENAKNELILVLVGPVGIPIPSEPHLSEEQMG